MAGIVARLNKIGLKVELPEVAHERYRIQTMGNMENMEKAHESKIRIKWKRCPDVRIYAPSKQFTQKLSDIPE